MRVSQGFRAICLQGLLTGAVLASGPFAMPAEGPLPFQRDRLPVDVDTMTRLSRQLAAFGRAADDDTPEGRRAAARVLALAIALDPANPQARDLLAARAKGETPEPADAGDLERFAADIRKLLEWLRTPESGPDGQALAACLNDILSSSTDPEQGKWSGWIPALASYRPAPPVKIPDAPPERPKNDPPLPGSVIARREAVVFSPLWTWERDGNRMVMRSIEVAMKARIEGQGDERKGFSFRAENTPDADSLRGVSDQLANLLRRDYERLPRGGRVFLTFNHGSDAFVNRNREAMTAAAGVLMDAAVSGREPAATVMGQIGADGSLKATSLAWDRLRLLSSSDRGGRLVIPREMEPMLASVLALEDPGFFLKYEVIAASNLKELAERSAAKAEGPLAEASARFVEIRGKAGTTPVGQFVANRFVRQRLTEIQQLFPDHLSSRLLLLQGGGTRPTKLPRKLLAAEIRKAFEPLSGLVRNEGPWNLEADAVDRTQESVRTAFEALDRYVDFGDRDLATRGRDLLGGLRTLSRAKRARYDAEDGNRTLDSAYSTLRRGYQALAEELASIEGEAPPRAGDRDR